MPFLVRIQDTSDDIPPLLEITPTFPFEKTPLGSSPPICPTFPPPGEIIPMDDGPTNLTPAFLVRAIALAVSEIGTCSVKTLIRGIFASMASFIAPNTAKLGTEIKDVLIPG